MKNFNISAKQSLKLYQLIKKEDENEIIFDKLFQKNYENINFQLRKYICEINTKNRKKGIGFFCKIALQDKTNFMPILIINSNLIGEEVTKNEIIIIKFKDKNEEINIPLENKLIYKNKIYDITFIEIKEENILDNNYLGLDDLILDNNSCFEKKINVYTMKYIEEKLYISFGKLKEIFEDNNNIYSFFKIKSAFNIFPIINQENNKLIGLHINNNINYNQNLFYLVNDFYNYIEIKYYIAKAMNEITDKKEYIGSGGFGKVYRIKYNNKIYALKQIVLINLSENEIKENENEAYILSHLHNEYIVKYYDSYYKDNLFNIIMEYAGDSNLKKFIVNHRESHQFIEQEIINKIIKQICIGLKEIHKCNIIHRDLKPENIFIDENNFKIKIGDFGISKISEYAYSCRGTFKYMAPEMRQGQKYNNKVDMYALGCIIYELFTLNNYSDNKDLNDIKEVDLDFYDPKWQKLINLLLDIKPDKRPNIDEVFKYLD